MPLRHFQAAAERDHCFFTGNSPFNAIEELQRHRRIAATRNAPVANRRTCRS